jgi:hypothetical protein
MNTRHDGDRFLSISATGALLLAVLSGGWSQASDIFVGTEYIYPTTFRVIGGTTAVGGLGGGVTTAPAVEPGGFQTRMVGASLSVEATVGDFAVSTKEVAAIEARGKNGNTELMVAAATGDETAVARILARGSSAEINKANQFGSTALMGASAGGFDKIVAMLLQKGAQVSARSRKGCTALMFAAKNGHASVVQSLLDAGAAVDAADEAGQTALMYAVDGGHVKEAGLLAASGANVNARTRKGSSVLALASGAQNQDLVVLLTKCGARK